MQSADLQWPVLLLGFAWLVSSSALIFLRPPFLQGFGFLVATFIFGVPFALIHRREVRRRATDLRREMFPEQ